MTGEFAIKNRIHHITQHPCDQRMNVFSRGISGISQALRGGADQLVRLSREAKAKVAANSLEQNQSRLSYAAAELYALTTTVLPQVSMIPQIQKQSSTACSRLCCALLDIVLFSYCIRSLLLAENSTHTTRFLYAHASLFFSLPKMR